MQQGNNLKGITWCLPLVSSVGGKHIVAYAKPYSLPNANMSDVKSNLSWKQKCSCRYFVSRNPFVTDLSVSVFNLFPQDNKNFNSRYNMGICIWVCRYSLCRPFLILLLYHLNILPKVSLWGKKNGRKKKSIRSLIFLNISHFSV